MMVISQDKKSVANYEQNIWQVNGNCIHLISIDNSNYLEFAKYKTEEDALKQLMFMTECLLKGFIIFEFK